MSDQQNPSGKSRRKFLKDLGSGMVGAYVAVPNLKLKTSTVKEHYIDALEGKVDLSIKVNGQSIKTKIKPNVTLAEFLRENQKLTGTKIVCNHGECGSCTVIINDEPVYSCHFLALDADGKEVLTIEGILDGEKLHSLQESFIDNDGLQCGFCTPGQIMTSYALLKHNDNPSDLDIKNAMSGNLCRCGAYPKIFDSVKNAINQKN